MGIMPLKVCAEPLGSNPANDTLLELAKVNTINRPRSDADTPQGQPQAVSAVQPPIRFHFHPPYWQVTANQISILFVAMPHDKGSPYYV